MKLETYNYRGRNHTTRHLWGKIPTKPPSTNRWACEQIFSSLTRKILQLAYYRNCRIDSNRTLHNDKNQQITNTIRGWSKRVHNKSKMADDRHFEKLQNRHISVTVLPIATICGTVMHTAMLPLGTALAVKISKF